MKECRYFLGYIFFIWTLLGNAQEDSTNSKWIQNDIDNFLELNDLINEGSLKASHVLNLPNVDIKKEDRIWFSSKRIKAAQHGGYISAWISMVTFDSEIIYLEFYFEEEDSFRLKELAKNDERIKNALKANWTVDKVKTLTDKSIEIYNYVFLNEEITKKYHQNVSKYFGNLNNISVESELKDAYEILINPGFQYDYGSTCYVENREPIGRKAIQLLVLSKRFDLIENIAKGYNPEGRAYAMEALLKNDKIEAEASTIIDKLKKLPLVVRTCEDCFLELRTYKSIVLDFKKSNNK